MVSGQGSPCRRRGAGPSCASARWADSARRDGTRATCAGTALGCGFGRPLHYPRYIVEPDCRRRHIHRPARARTAAANARAQSAHRSTSRKGSCCSAHAHIGGAKCVDRCGGFFRDRAIGDDAAAHIISALPVVIIPSSNGAIALSSQSWEHIRAAAGEKLDAFHQPTPIFPAFRLSNCGGAVTPFSQRRYLLPRSENSSESGDAALDRSWVRRPSHQVKFSAEEERLLASIIRNLRAEPYRPPRVRDIAKAMAVDETACAASCSWRRGGARRKKLRMTTSLCAALSRPWRA